jgi:GAF domain-containing protein
MNPTPDRTLDDPQQTIADLKRQLAESNAERDEAPQRETATSEVLQVINSSPGDLGPVFDAILEKAHSLCAVTIGALEVWDGESVRALATRGLPQEFEDLIRQGYEPEPNDPHWALVNGDRFVHLPNLGEIDDPTSRTAARIVGTGTFLAVALRKDDVLLGRIVAARQEVRPFAEKEIALLENFAAHAVIAMENARLITETREALEQQTATAEVLGVINSSPGNLAPVFDAILEKAHSLCGSAFGSLQLYDNGKFRAVAVRGMPGARWRILRKPVDPLPGTPARRLLGGERIVHVADMAPYAEQRPDDLRTQATTEHGLRTALFVPLRRDADLLGYLTAFRQEVRAFTDKQIALLENFAAQAVIAMENARLITETQDALEQQTATAEVLQVINSSPGDLVPVFDAMLEKATALCEASRGQLAIYDGKCFRFVAAHGEAAYVEDLVQRG